MTEIHAIEGFVLQNGRNAYGSELVDINEWLTIHISSTSTCVTRLFPLQPHLNEWRKVTFSI